MRAAGLAPRTRRVLALLLLVPFFLALDLASGSGGDWFLYPSAAVALLAAATAAGLRRER